MGFDSPSRHHLSYLISMCYERAADLSRHAGTNTAQPSSHLFSII
jgi:hypothetical protein